jgi:hypothetical protein
METINRRFDNRKEIRPVPPAFDPSCLRGPAPLVRGQVRCEALLTWGGQVASVMQADFGYGHCRIKSLFPPTFDLSLIREARLSGAGRSLRPSPTNQRVSGFVPS